NRSPGCDLAARQRLSMTESFVRTFVIWKVLIRPSLAMRYADRPVMCCPANSMRPLSGDANPVIMSNSVLLPAPFGPISEVIEPRLTLNDARSSAWTPLKRLEILLTTRCESLVKRQLLLFAEQTLRAKSHDPDDQRPN